MFKGSVYSSSRAKSRDLFPIVIPAQAGIQSNIFPFWTPAFAGVTDNYRLINELTSTNGVAPEPITLGILPSHFSIARSCRMDGFD